MSEGRRITRFKDRDDGMVEQWVGRERGEMALQSVRDPEEMRPREEDAYPAEPKPPHIEGCRVVPFRDRSRPGILVCAEGCPELAQAIRRGQELAKEYGW